MSSNNLAPVGHFSSVKKAREALRGQALQLLEEYKAMIKAAAASGKYEEALKAMQWLIDHVPAEDGERIFDTSVDKPAQAEGPKGPVVQIAQFQLGGLGEAKEALKLINPTIEAEVLKDGK